MTFAIAAAGTGGHVFPGLSVGEALVDLGVAPDEILFIGGDRLEATVYPAEGFPFLQVEIRGLQRSLTLENLGLPAVVMRAKRRIAEDLRRRSVRAVLGLGGYATIPAALAARSTSAVFMHSEQNAEAGLANRLVARWAIASFGSFPETVGLPDAEWVGNPVRKRFWSFDRGYLLAEAVDRYQLHPGRPVLGVFGGSLGAGAINDAIAALVSSWSDPPLQLVHLTGERNTDSFGGIEAAPDVEWHRVGFENRMELFYAACDLVVARAGGAVAELTATATPSILVPGRFGSSGHQAGNARFLSESGAAVTVDEDGLDRLGDVVRSILFSTAKLQDMETAARRIARPGAARIIAKRMMESIR